MKTKKIELLNKVWDNYKKSYSQRPVDVETKVIDEVAANIFCPGPNYSFVFEFASRELTYTSPEIINVLGIDNQGYTLEKYLDQVHTDDIPYLLRCEKKIADFLFDRQAPKRITKYKFAYCYRMRHKDGSNQLILHQAIAISRDGFGRVSKVLNIDTIIDHIFCMNNYNLSIIGLDGEPSYLNIDVSGKNGSYINQTLRPFSIRELQVISLFADGHTADRVGRLLGISTGTIRTHRQNVLHKSGCSNMTELVARCVREGIV